MIYAGFQKSNYSNRLNPRELTGNWHSKIRPSIFYFEFSEWKNIKAMMYYALIELRGLHVKGFFERLQYLVFNSVSFSKHYCSAFTTIVSMEFKEDGALVVSGGSISTAQGERYPGVMLERMYHIDNGKLVVEEKITSISDEKLKLKYRFPENSRIIEHQIDFVQYEITYSF